MLEIHLYKAVRMLVLGLVCSVAAQAVWAQQMVVIQSAASALPVGKSLDANSVLELGASQSITLIAESGQIRQIKGPYKGQVGAFNALKTSKDSAARQAMSRLISARAEDNFTLGTVRRQQASMDWLQPSGAEGWNIVSAEHDGVQCVFANQPLGVIRQNKGLELAQVRSAIGDYLSIQWAENQAMTDWPKNLPVVDGGVYLIRRTGNSIPYKLVLKKMDMALLQTAPAYQAAVLIGQQCWVQAHMALGQEK